MDNDKIIEEYIRMFGKMPPADMVIDYYDDFYINLMKIAIHDREEITPEVLELAIGDKPYDRTEERKLTNFKKE